MPRPAIGQGGKVYFAARWLPYLKAIASAINNRPDRAAAIEAINNLRALVEQLPDEPRS